MNIIGIIHAILVFSLHPVQITIQGVQKKNGDINGRGLNFKTGTATSITLLSTESAFS